MVTILPDYPLHIYCKCIHNMNVKFEALWMNRSCTIKRSCLIFLKLDLITVHDLHMFGT